jgi:Ca2+/Na+ antiporter
MFKKVESFKEDIFREQEYLLDLELKREKLIFQKSRSHINLIGFLLFTVFYIMFELIKLNKVPVLVTIFSLVLVIVLLISLFFSIKSERIHKINYKMSTEALINDDINTKNDDLREIQIKLEKQNNKRRKDLIVSSIFLYIFLGLFLAFGLVTVIVIL